MTEPIAKRAKMDEIPSHINDMGEEVKKALIELDIIQNDIDIINEKAYDEILKIEQKYNSLRVPHYEKRIELIKNIPKFWATTILNHPQLCTIIEDREVELLNAITNIEVEEAEDARSGYKIRFTFAPNDYLENEKVEKEFIISEKPASTTTPIRWKDSKCLARTEDSDSPLSFFEWMAENVDPGNDDIADILKDDLWTNPVQHFLCPEVEDVGGDYENLADEEEALEEGDEEAGSDGDN
ncbi:unnamed protein product [Auanema sp. JU1783]|nr:unnamed protein product [Auanema sp. JU1783]